MYTNRIFKRAANQGASAQAWSSGVHEGLGQVVPVAGPAIAGADALGSTIGLMTGSASDKALERYDKTPAVDIVPGVAGFRSARRRKRLSKDLGGSAGRSWGQQFGPGTAALLLALIGGTIGSFAAEPAKKIQGFGKGALVGGSVAGSATLAGALAAALTKTRTKEEQEAYQKDRNKGQANWLIPGVGTYNKWKSRGYLMHKSEQ